jgi:hypothetical protein
MVQDASCEVWKLFGQTPTRSHHGVTCQVGYSVPAGCLRNKSAKQPIQLHIIIVSGEHQQIVERKTGSLRGNRAHSLRRALRSADVSNLEEILDPGPPTSFGEARNRVRSEDATSGCGALSTSL